MLPLPSVSLRLSVLAGVGAAVGLLMAGPIAAAPPACVDETPPNCADNSPAPVDPGGPEDPGANVPLAFDAENLPTDVQAAHDALMAAAARFEAIQLRVAAMHELVAKLQAAQASDGDASTAAQELRDAVHALLTDFSGALPGQAILGLLGDDDGHDDDGDGGDDDS